MRIDWNMTAELGDHHTIGRLTDGRWFWTWNMGSALSPEKLLTMGSEDGEDGGLVFGSYAELLNYIEGGEQYDLVAMTKEQFGERNK